MSLSRECRATSTGNVKATVATIIPCTAVDSVCDPFHFRTHAYASIAGLSYILRFHIMRVLVFHLVVLHRGILPRQKPYPPCNLPSSGVSFETSFLSSMTSTSSVSSYLFPCHSPYPGILLSPGSPFWFPNFGGSAHGRYFPSPRRLQDGKTPRDCGEFWIVSSFSSTTYHSPLRFRLKEANHRKCASFQVYILGSATHNNVGSVYHNYKPYEIRHYDFWPGTKWNSRYACSLLIF